MTAKLTICSSYFALPGGQKVYDNVDLAQTTIQSIKEKLSSEYSTVCPLPLLNLWWNGYLLDPEKSILESCIGVDVSERVPPSVSNLTIFLTVQELNKKYVDGERGSTRERKSSFDIRLQEFGSTKNNTNCITS
mmetsp:Transcript_18908/g.35051  ORF Transcript_18908/g.35051 Transcript_18908/m.35051 type:complete len:134 (-) Transcript_18908:60-461(-)|eukprot:CAMPEP_0182493260 /NCGR_PEP_ID=MMETSP1321-20130603/2250_1 /TAXON_ID=91990 /ORGANISM="Bolidomonas sp., Strain RCC1657" /LENGTH=133 /DNA_ID=CAMNT_0024695975 /DNA_START=154 /DNA_END=555 /DNA_ORIENTATION=+